MQNNKVIRLLKSLDSAEFRLLHKYFRSPFFNYSASILTLYEVLRKYYPNFEHPHLEAKYVFGKIFPGEPFRDKKFRNLLHEFLGHIENFLVQLRIRQEDYTSKKLLLEALANRDLYPIFEQKNRELVSEVEARPYRDIGTYLELLCLQEQYYFHPATDKLQHGALALQAMLRHLDHYFIAGKLKMAIEVTTRGKVVQQDFEMRFMEPVLARLDQEGPDELLLSTYGLLYRLQEEEAESLFFEAKQKLFYQSHQFSFSDRQVILFQLLNFAIRRGNTGMRHFLEEAFGLYLFGLQAKLLFEHEKLTDSTFINICFLGGKIGALNEVEVFIEENAKFLDELVREDARALALAYLYYYRKSFEKVDLLIGQVQFHSSFYQLRARLILLRALFELFLDNPSFFDLLMARIDAFDRYLRRNAHISELQTSAYLVFIKFLKAIVKQKLKKINKRERLLLKEKIMQSEITPNKDWLLAQV